MDFFAQVENLRWDASINMENPPRSRIIPKDIFSFSLLPITNELDQSGVTGSFSSSGIRSVIVAARMDFEPSEAGQKLSPRRKLYTETYFTDPDTARFISGVRSFTGSNFPLSAMNVNTQVLSHVSLMKAVRASIAEPLLTSPPLVDDRYYMGAAADLNPIYLARALADEVIARKPTEFNNFFEAPGIEAVFGFDPNQVSRKVSEAGVDRWIDVPEGTYPSLSPDAQLNIWGAIHSFNPARIVKFASLVPDTYEGYLEVFDAQYATAYKGAYTAGSSHHP